MKSKKLIFATLIALLAVCVLASVANAQTTQPAFDFSVTGSDNGVNNPSTNTLTLTNTGTVNIVGANITVPAGYTNIENAVVTQGWTASITRIENEPDVINIVTTGAGIANGQSVTVTFEATNPQAAGTYGWSTTATTMDGATVTQTADSIATIVSLIPMAEILLIAAAIAFVNTIVNRVLINYFIGWEQYRVMQKEMAEYRSESMAAARSGDQKRMEKIKKKQSQITNMQQKMMKPQMLQIGISFLYLIVWWVVLIPTFGNTSIAYLPGIGPLPVIWLYPIFSFFLALISQRVIGVNPIEM